jgi:SAM-dependent methyltransferase
MKKFDNFDPFANNYRDIHNENIKSTGADSDYFAEYKMLELQKHINVDQFVFLDFGCGDGQIYVFFKKYFPNATYIGLDISKESIERASLKFPEANFKVYDGYNIANEINKVDVAFISCVLHHINHDLHYEVLKGIYNLLNKNGILVVFEHNPFNPVTVKIVNECIFDEDAVLLKHNYLKNQLKKVGFTSINIFFTLFFPRHKIFRFLLPLEKFLSSLPLGGQYYSVSKK